MFRINWTSKITGMTGHGEAIYTEKEAQEQTTKLNAEIPELRHEIEKIQEPLTPLNIKGHRCSYGDLSFVAHPSPTNSIQSLSTPKASGLASSQVSSPLAQEQSPQPQ